MYVRFNPSKRDSKTIRFSCIRLKFVMVVIHLLHSDSTLIARFLINGLASYLSA